MCGEALRKRRLSSFQLDALVVIEINRIVDQFSGLLKRPDFLQVNAISFEDREEIFSHSVIIAVSAS